jgi:hypothetical protein
MKELKEHREVNKEAIEGMRCYPQPFVFNERVIWDSGFGYEIGYFLGEGELFDSYLIDVRTGIIHEPTCYSKSEIHKYSNELIDKLFKKYGYEKRFSGDF